MQPLKFLKKGTSQKYNKALNPDAKRFGFKSYKFC